MVHGWLVEVERWGGGVVVLSWLSPSWVPVWGVDRRSFIRGQRLLCPRFVDGLLLLSASFLIFGRR